MGRKGPSFIFVERTVPDPRRVNDGLRMLGRLIAETYARDKQLIPSNGHHDPSWMLPQEESSDEPEN